MRRIKACEVSEIAAEMIASPLTGLATVVRFGAYLGALVAAGGMLFIAVVHDRRLANGPVWSPR